MLAWAVETAAKARMRMAFIGVTVLEVVSCMRIQAYLGDVVTQGEMVHLYPMTSDDCTDLLKALADRTRQRIVKALLATDLCVNELTERLGVSQYNVSKHLKVLKSAGIVDSRAIGQRREYHIATTFRRRIEREGVMLDFGCCTFRMDRLPD
jgi:DNA-binding transcriptional ArsR family regulator